MLTALKLADNCLRIRGSNLYIDNVFPITSQCNNNNKLYFCLHLRSWWTAELDIPTGARYQTFFPEYYKLPRCMKKQGHIQPVLVKPPTFSVALIQWRSATRRSSLLRVLISVGSFQGTALYMTESQKLGHTALPIYIVGIHQTMPVRAASEKKSPLPVHISNDMF